MHCWTGYGFYNHSSYTGQFVTNSIFTVKLRYNKPLYNEVFGLSSNFLYPSNSKMEKKPRYSVQVLLVPWPFVNSRFYCSVIKRVSDWNLFTSFNKRTRSGSSMRYFISFVAIHCIYIKEEIVLYRQRKAVRLESSIRFTKRRTK